MNKVIKYDAVVEVNGNTFVVGSFATLAEAEAAVARELAHNPKVDAFVLSW